MKSARLLLLLSAVLTLAACRTSPKPLPNGQPVIPDNLAVRGQVRGRLDLTDGSRWQVQPAGQSASLRWRPGDTVRAVRSGHPAWPWLLTHRSTHASALARPFPVY